MKIGKTRTHYKLYVTERELEVLINVFEEGAQGLCDNWRKRQCFIDGNHDIDRAALDHIGEGLWNARVQSLGGES